MKNRRINWKKTITLSIIFGVIGFAVGGLIEYSYAEEETYNQKIGIALSKSCMLSENCIKYDDLLLIHLDSSNRNISGGFDYVNEIFQREPPQLEHHFKWYDHFNTNAIFIDPPADIRNKIFMIYVEPQLGDFVLSGDHKISDGIRTLHNTRYVDSNCHSATISDDNLRYVLPDTIYYLYTGCEFDRLNTVKIIQQEQFSFNHNSSKAWNELNHWQNMKEACKIKC